MPSHNRSVTARRSPKPRKRATVAGLPGNSRAELFDRLHRAFEAIPQVSEIPQRMRERYMDAIDSVADYLESIGADALWVERFDKLSGAVPAAILRPEIPNACSPAANVPGRLIGAHKHFNVANQMVQVNIETVIMFGDVASSVRKAFDENGSVGCSLICETEDGERVIFEAAGTLGNRAVAMNTVRKLFRRLKVARYVRVTRCWAGYTDASIHPTENANCIEGIMILSADNTSVRMRSIAEIKGGADGKAALGPWEPIEISDGWRFDLVEMVRGCCG